MASAAARIDPPKSKAKTWAARIAPELQRHQGQQHALAGAGRADHQGVADVADMKRQPERRCAFGLGEQERRTAEVVVPFGACPDRRQRHHVGKVQGRDRRLANIGIDVAGQASEPGLDGVHALGDAGEVAALDDLLDQPQLLVSDTRVFVPDRDGGRHIGLADRVGAEFLERRVGIHRLVVGVGIEQRRGFVGHHLLQDRDDRLALGEPLAADAGQDLGGVGLVERDGAGRPAVRKRQPVELIEEARMGHRRKSHHGEGPQMRLAEPRLEPADERFVGEDRIEIHRHLGDADAVTPGRDAGMQVGQRLRVR